MSANPSVRGDVTEYDLLFDCVHCGLCLEACPTYAVTRAEMDSPRGRIYLMKALAEGRLKLDADAARHLDLCLGCRGCETACPSGVKYGRLIEGARVFVERNHRRALTDRIRRRAIGAIFPYPGRLRAMLAPLRLMERLGMRPAMRALAPGRLGEWLDLLPERTRAKRRASARVAATDGPPALVHHGCVARVLAESANVNSERALELAGYRVAAMDRTVCCGALDLHAGNHRRALDLARITVNELKRVPGAAIVSCASGCSAAMADYGRLLADDPAADDAREVAARVTDLATLLQARSLPPGELECVVTWHDACHLAHGMGVREAPRKLLGAIAGVRLVELQESDMCCGSAGSYNLTEPAMARELVRRKVDNVIATGAEFVVMANPGCEFQIAAELRRRGSRVRAIHLADFLALAERRGRAPT